MTKNINFTDKEPKKRSLIAINNLSFSIGEKTITESWSFNVKTKEITLIIGKNGSGKTTFAKIIAGFDGYNNIKNISRINKIHISYMPQNIEINSFVPITVGYFIDCFQSISLPSLLESLGIDKILDRKLQDLSGGELQKVMFFAAISQNSDLIILDEPDNHLDKESQEIVEKTILSVRNNGRSVVLISHKTPRIVDSIDHILDMDNNILCGVHSNCNDN